MKYFVILIMLLILSFIFVAVKERVSGDYVSQELNFISEGMNLEAGSGDAENKNVIIIADISDLNMASFADSTLSPFFSRILKKSRVYSAVYPLSPDRNDKLESFLKCLPPYRIYSEGERFGNLKKLINEKLRNSSMINEFREEGYVSAAFFKDGSTVKKLSDYFDSTAVYADRKKMIEDIFRSVIRERAQNFVLYADLTEDGDEKHYLLSTGDMLEKLCRTLSENYGFKVRLLLISTDTSPPLAGTVSIFYGFRLDPYVDCLKIALTDISRTLMRSCGLTIRNYFAGYDLSEGGSEQLRDYFAGQSEDTLLLFDDSLIYKRINYSNEFLLIDRESGSDITGSDPRINEKYEDMIPEYFGGDYIKYLVFRNRSETSRVFKTEISSKRRFAEFDALDDYYGLKRRNYRYTQKIERELDPGASDTVKIYYSSLYQDFRFDFKEKLRIAYGPAGINGGDLKIFDENSYYGMTSPETDPEPVFLYDVYIFSRRINF